MRIVKKRAVTVNLRVRSFLKNAPDPFCIERSRELSAGCVLNAMHRPQNLLNSTEHNAVAGFFARMIGSKAAVIGWMPVLRSDNQLKVRLQLVGERNDFFAMGHR